MGTTPPREAITEYRRGRRWRCPEAPEAIFVPVPMAQAEKDAEWEQ
jgi:hypothetical protein